jgi:hypothetical protein
MFKPTLSDIKNVAKVTLKDDARAILKMTVKQLFARRSDDIKNDAKVTLKNDAKMILKIRLK